MFERTTACTYDILFVKVKSGGQAATKGVQVGWQVKKVGGTPVGESWQHSDSVLTEAIRLAIQQCVDAGQEFTIDFDTTVHELQISTSEPTVH